MRRIGIKKVFGKHYNLKTLVTIVSKVKNSNISNSNKLNCIISEVTN